MSVLGVDFANLPDLNAAKKAGYVYGITYLAPPDQKYDWKRLTPQVRDALFSAGFSILAVFESYATRALEGVQAGIEDAKTAQAAAQTLGYPPDVPIFAACDTNATADQARPYMRGFASVRPCMGVYGGIKVVDPLLADGTARFGWQTCAWSNDPQGKALVSQIAHLYQRLRPTLGMPGSGFDEDVLLKPLPMWVAQQPPQPAPAPQPATQGDPHMWSYIIRVADGPLKDAEFFNYGQGPVHIDGPEALELTAAPNPVPVKSLSGALFARRFPGVTA